MIDTRVLGIDPGGTTGVAMIKFPSMTLEHACTMTLDDVFDEAFTLVGPADYVAIQRYTITQRTAQMTRQPDAMYAIGALMMACRRARVPLELQQPNDAKASFPDKVLRQLGVWDSSDHVRDAIRHALLGLRRSGLHVQVSV